MKTVVEHDVTILGPANLPSTVPFHASQMFAKNCTNFLKELTKDGQLAIDLENEVHRRHAADPRRRGRAPERSEELLGMPANETAPGEKEAYKWNRT